MTDEWKNTIGHLAFLFCLAVVGFVTLSQCGCMPGSGKPAAYSTELVACNQTAFTLCESITCENKVRAAYARPPRLLPAECGGVK